MYIFIYIQVFSQIYFRHIRNIRIKKTSLVSTFQLFEKIQLKIEITNFNCKEGSKMVILSLISPGTRSFLLIRCDWILSCSLDDVRQFSPGRRRT